MKRLAMETYQGKLVEEKEESSKSKVKFTPFQRNQRGNAIGFPGVNKRKEGTFGAVIKDPLKKKTIWLGTFNTPQEASKAYLLKKQEFLANGLLGTQRLKNGRYGARIKDPFSHKEVWLGTFETVEEASEANFSKKSEFEKLDKVNTGKGSIICVESSEEASCVMVKTHGTKSSDACIYNVTAHPKAKRSLLGTPRRKNGWNATVVRDLIRSKKVLFGTYDTVVDDSEAYFSNKSEFEKLSKGNVENKPKTCYQIQTGSPVGVSVDNDQTLNVASVGSKQTTHFVGVRKRNSGRYTSEIYNPISKKMLYLGMFDTAEEASQAFQSKKLEIQKLVKAKQDGKEKLLNAKQGQLESACGASSLETDVPMSNSSNGGCNQRIESHDISHSMGVQKRKHTSEILLETLGTAEEAFNAYQCNKSVFPRSKKAELQSDMPTNSSAGENQEGEENEDMWMGQWVQLPGNKEVNISLKLGVPIIDNYGSLLGEFRSIDDLRVC